MDIPLEVKNLAKSHGDQFNLNEISFEVRPGQIVGILGPNGCGKSTTLHCITSYYRLDSGNIHITGVDHHEEQAKQNLGFLPDDLPLPGDLTGAELLTLHRSLRPQMDIEVVYELLEIMGILDHLRKFVGDYSHGMKRKLQLALALGHNPQLLVLDEPMRGLDPEAAILMRQVVESYSQAGKGVLIATHDLDSAARTCTSVVILNDGQLVTQGAPHDLVKLHQAASLEEVFLQVTGISEGVKSKVELLSETLRQQLPGAPSKPYNGAHHEVLQ